MSGFTTSPLLPKHVVSSRNGPPDITRARRINHWITAARWSTVNNFNSSLQKQGALQIYIDLSCKFFANVFKNM